MTIFEANISSCLVDFFKANWNNLDSFENANSFLEEICGVQFFFHNSEELTEFKKEIQHLTDIFEEPNRRAYGDFQTNEDLANNVVKRLSEKEYSPEFLIEPTCGKGKFIIASLKKFKTLKKVIGIEIYKPYVWETKFGILELYLKNEPIEKAQIQIKHADIFNFNLASVAKENQHLNLLVIGNPPWVTNSELGILNSKNLPRKSNFKKHNGIDAITGKGNFDIAEYITIQLLNHFDQHDGTFAFLVKNSVVKNILFDQMKRKHHIGSIQKLNIDAKKEFNVSVDACLFLTTFNSTPEFILWFWIYKLT